MLQGGTWEAIRSQLMMMTRMLGRAFVDLEKKNYERYEFRGYSYGVLEGQL